MTESEQQVVQEDEALNVLDAETETAAEPTQQQAEAPARVSRRDFLTMAWGAVASMTAFGLGYVGLRFLGSRRTDGAFGTLVNAGLLEEFPPGTVTAIENARAYLIRRDDGALLALYWKCTHLDCVVLWDAPTGAFTCPCHGSGFDTEGAVLNPPAPRPLTRFPVEVVNASVRIDTATLIERHTVTDDDFVFPPITPTPEG